MFAVFCIWALNSHFRVVLFANLPGRRHLERNVVESRDLTGINIGNAEDPSTLLGMTHPLDAC